MELKGIGVSPGIACGRIFRPDERGKARPETYVPGTAAEERQRLEAASGRLAADLNKAADERRRQGETEAADILEAHALMAIDPTLLQSAGQEIANGKDAPTAILAAADKQAAMLEALADGYLRERAADVRDIGQSLVRALTGARESLPEGALLVTGQEVSPELLGTLPAERLAGVILGGGSATIHAAILARARGIPAVVGLGAALEKLPEGATALLDGDAGIVNTDPTAADIAAAEATAIVARLEAKKRREWAGLGAITRDGLKLHLLANAASSAEVEKAMTAGAEGIGLLRSEFLFLGRDTLPDEEEQYRAYRTAVEAAGGKRCVIRTLDIGGDKPLRALPLPLEANPFLGQRGLRVSLAHPDLFRTQLRAILRAGAAGAVSILLPMVTDASEVEAAREHLAACYHDLQRAGVSFGEDVPLGVMVETPAAALLAESLGAHCDFLSLGTNDLTQYALAADRSNPAMASLGDYLHPAVLRLVDFTVQGGDAAAIPVSVCGEMAADPLAAPLLLALGVSALSMNPAMFPEIARAISQITVSEAKDFLETSMAMPTATAVRDFLQSELPD